MSLPATHTTSRFASALDQAQTDGRLSWTDGVPDVRLNKDVYYGEIPRERMLALLDRVAAAADPAAFERAFIESAGQYTYDYAFDPARADWLNLFMHRERPAVLDYGAGLGNFAMRLSEQAGEVWVVDSTPERLAVIRNRARAWGRTNIFPLLCDRPDLIPLPEGGFDMILLNGVLEWMAVGSGRPVEPAHRSFLTGLARLLKPGGSLVVAIENRYGLQHFMGLTEHNDFKFAAILPRAVASGINRLLKKQPYETYTYSAAELRRLTASAGLEVASHWAAWPSYQSARVVTAFDAPASVQAEWLGAMLPRHSRRWRLYRVAWNLLGKLGLSARLAPAFIIEGVRRPS